MYIQLPKKIPVASLLLSIFCLCDVSAAQGDLGTGNHLKQPPMLVDDAWLVEHMNDNNLVIIDVRPRTDYLKGHIIGAVSLPTSDTFSRNTQTDRLAPAMEIKATFGQAGIGKDTYVVAYDGGQFRNAGRVIWSMHAYGHDKTSMLTIDYDTWISNGHPISIYETKLKHKIFTPVIKPARIATAFQTLLATNNKNTTIVDVRVSEEYRGEKSRAARYGHIPSAINIDWHDMAVSDGDKNKLKSLEELRELFSTIPENNDVVTYCHKGREAALAYIALRLLGHDVRLYDGSWFEWGNSTTYPVEGPDTHPATPEHK